MISLKAIDTNIIGRTAALIDELVYQLNLLAEIEKLARKTNGFTEAISEARKCTSDNLRYLLNSADELFRIGIQEIKIDYLEEGK